MYGGITVEMLLAAYAHACIRGDEAVAREVEKIISQMNRESGE